MVGLPPSMGGGPTSFRTLLGRVGQGCVTLTRTLPRSTSRSSLGPCSI
jgi:hypothetical protein